MLSSDAPSELELEPDVEASPPDSDPADSPSSVPAALEASDPPSAEPYPAVALEPDVVDELDVDETEASPPPPDSLSLPSPVTGAASSMHAQSGRMTAKRNMVLLLVEVVLQRLTGFLQGDLGALAALQERHHGRG